MFILWTMASEEISDSTKLPPYDKNGNVIPVHGIRFVTTARLRLACNIIPNDKYLANKSSHFLDILKPV